MEIQNMKAACLGVLFLCLSSFAYAGGSIPWDWVHAEIEKQDKLFLNYVDQNFDVNHVGGAMRPISGERAGERFAPYTFLAKPKGAQGDYVFMLTFEPTGRDDNSWSFKLERVAKKP